MDGWNAEWNGRDRSGWVEKNGSWKSKDTKGVTTPTDKIS
jgi:hypothetical protein